MKQLRIRNFLVEDNPIDFTQIEVYTDEKNLTLEETQALLAFVFGTQDTIDTIWIPDNIGETDVLFAVAAETEFEVKKTIAIMKDLINYQLYNYFTVAIDGLE